MYTLTLLFQKLSNLFSTSTCLLCNKGPSTLCEHCISLLVHSREKKDPFTFIFLSYKDVRTKRILGLAKYEHRTSLYTPLIMSWLKEDDISLLLSKEKDTSLLVGMPMHRWRLIFRGYNHAEKIVSIISKESGIRADSHLLEKKLYTSRQALLSRNERIHAQKGSFKVKQGEDMKLLGKRVILVDDIMTTGSTFNEAKKVLLLAGAREVVCIALAH